MVKNWQLLVIMAFHERRVLAQGSNSISQFLNMVRAIFLPHLSDETLSRSSLQLMFFFNYYYYFFFFF